MEMGIPDVKSIIIDHQVNFYYDPDSYIMKIVNIAINGRSPNGILNIVFHKPGYVHIKLYLIHDKGEDWGTSISKVKMKYVHQN